MTKEEIAKRFPEAVKFAREMRAEFGDGIRIVYAKNAEGQTLGNLDAPDTRTPTVSLSPDR